VRRDTRCDVCETGADGVTKVADGVEAADGVADGAAGIFSHPSFANLGGDFVNGVALQAVTVVKVGGFQRKDRSWSTHHGLALPSGGLQCGAWAA
jgi:hypothetical protein